MSEIEINGLDVLCGALKRKAKATSKSALAKVVRQNASEMQNKAMKAAPCDTGALKRSITLNIQDGGLRAIVYPYMNYAPYVEYGTRFMEAQPFLRPGFIFQSDQFKKDLKRMLES